MTRNPVTAGVLITATALTLAVVPKVLGQAAPAAPTPAAPAESEDVVVMSPFVVEASEDRGYQATSTLAGTRVRTDLKDTTSSISVVTTAFLRDTAANNTADLLVYTANTEVGGLHGNFSGQGSSPQFSETSSLINPSNTTRVRGLDAADNTRDFFLTDIPWDSYNVGRVDLQRGPNSILFGVGSPAGIINTSPNDASYKTAYHVENQLSSFGAIRNSIDLNQVLIKGVLAIRVSALANDAQFQQKFAYNKDKRYYGALRFDPKLIANETTTIRVKFEHGKVNSNNPRTLPPTDEISRWFETGTTKYGQPGMNKATINMWNPGTDNGSTLANKTFNVGPWAQGRAYFQDPLSYLNGAVYGGLGNTQVLIPPVNSGVPSYIYMAQLPQSNVQGLPNYRPAGIASFNIFANDTGNTVPFAGQIFYADFALTDPTVFDFYHTLIDGPNKREWQGWNALNMSIQQSALKGRLNFELAYDHQDYESGNQALLNNSADTNAISVDVNQTFSDGSKNANVGRPYIAGSSATNSQSNHILRDSLRLTATGELRASDFLGKTEAAKILGKHVFTAEIDETKRRAQSIIWNQYAADPSWAVQTQNSVNSMTSVRQFDFVYYIGPSLLGANSASGAKLGNLDTKINPGATTQVTYFNRTWNKPTDPNDPKYVDPNAAWPTMISYSTGVAPTDPKIMIQANNPANYVGFGQTTVNWLSDQNPVDKVSLINGGSKTSFRDLSKSLIWQGYMLDGDLVPTYGWRKDSVTNLFASASAGANGYGTTPTEYSYGTTPDRQTGQSRSYGAVYHFPKMLMSKVPGGTTFSIFYNHGQNFKADVPRLNLEGKTIPNPNGRTKEYGFTITTLDDKLSLKVGWYETNVTGATFNVTNGNNIAGLGGNGYVMWAAPAWGYREATRLQEGLRDHGYYAGDVGVDDPTWVDNYWDYGAGDVGQGKNNGLTRDQINVKSKAIADAWLKFPVPDNFFDIYGIYPFRPHPALIGNSGWLINAWPTAPVNRQNSIGDLQKIVPDNIVSTVDTTSKGTEVELTAAPNKNWNLTINYSRTNATRENIDPLTIKFFDDMRTFFQGPGGQLRMWGNTQGESFQQRWNGSVDVPYQVNLLALGQRAPELAPWRLNAITTYNIDEGIAKGAFIGAALRMEAGKILGYKFNPALGYKDAITGATSGSLDPKQTQEGPTDNHVDVWLGYRRKITDKINWRIQLNLRNVGETNKLVPARYQPDGSIALARIQEGMTYTLTNSFDF